MSSETLLRAGKPANRVAGSIIDKPGKCLACYGIKMKRNNKYLIPSKYIHAFFVLGILSSLSIRLIILNYIFIFISSIAAIAIDLILEHLH
jgi:hypothetical protein